MNIKEFQKKQLQIINKNTSSLSEFKRYLRQAFTIKEICSMLNINKNRYYYLERTNQLNFLLWELIENIENESLEND